MNADIRLSLFNKAEHSDYQTWRQSENISAAGVDRNFTFSALDRCGVEYWPIRTNTSPSLSA